MATRKRGRQKAKKIGRPRSTGPGVALMVRVHVPQLTAIDAWIGETGLSRPEAIRQLVNWALEQVKN
jgi:hypothetical protein